MIDQTHEVKITDAELTKIHEGVLRDYKLGSPNSARALREAADYDLDVVFPTDCELQLDIDDDRAFYIFQELKPIVDRYYAIFDEKVTPSRSGLPKRHVTLKLGRKVTPLERIALQTCLGSDRVRELLGVIQVLFQDPHPTLFLEKKAENADTTTALPVD
jgi:hypothetical protein